MKKLKIASALTSALTVLAALPYELETLGSLIPPAWKEKAVLTGLLATVALRILGNLRTGARE
jgi:hypothetical protein